MKRIFYTIIFFIILSAIGPLAVLLQNEVDMTSSIREASRESAQLALDPLQHPDAVVHVFVARVYNWRGLFSVHPWIAVKPAGAKRYTVYEVLNWRRRQGLSLVAAEQNIPDRLWFGNQPELILTMTGKEAEAVIPKIDRAAREYIYTDEYHYWPGPNSNTFIATIAKQVPEMKLVMPGNAVGKDYLPLGQFWTRAPSGTGYQLSLGGVFSMMLAWEEGLEINILGLVYGISPVTRTLKLPGIGDIVF